MTTIEERKAQLRHDMLLALVASGVANKLFERELGSGDALWDAEWVWTGKQNAINQLKQLAERLCAEGA
jgi:hypothetical protein